MVRFFYQIRNVRKYKKASFLCVNQRNLRLSTLRPPRLFSACFAVKNEFIKNKKSRSVKTGFYINYRIFN